MNEPLACLNGDFIPASSLSLPVDDLGFVQGAAVSERLRTFRGAVYRLEDHLERLANSLRMVDLQPHLPLQRIGALIEELAAHNFRLLAADDDLGVSLFVTPGVPGQAQPTVGIEAYPLPFGRWAHYYDHGQALMETGIRQVPEVCWPPALKCRSRMHYFLADRAAQRLDPGARAVLLDLDGGVSEASTANIVMFRRDEGLVSPPRERILPGVSLAVLEELARGLGIPWQYRTFGWEELTAADEILLCSTSPCVWPVTRLNRRPLVPGVTGETYRRLLEAWGETVGVEIAAQARRFAARC